ncbi:MAG TPA: hypothetical protein VGP64_04535 [Polyangia bacterium]
MTTLRRASCVALVAAATALGCYSPNIAAGGFRCGDGDAGVCPDNFQCAADHRCYRGPVDAAVDKAMVCTSMTLSPVQGCSGGATGGGCSPACQTGCDCGWCAVVGGASKCVTGTAGLKDAGEVCDPTNATAALICKAGLYCQPECGDTTGRCYRYCPSNMDSTVCGTGSTCNVTLRELGGGIPTAGFLLCSLTSSCTVVPQDKCPLGFSCYAGGLTQNECDCPGTVSTGDSCSATPQCSPGNLCIGPKMGTTCHQACNESNGNADCPAGMTCNSSGTLYGYCM